MPPPYLPFKYFLSITPPIEEVDPNPAITLIFPDQEYVISARDLETNETELIIPTLDSTIPRISYNANLGMLVSIISPQDYVLDFATLRSDFASHSGESPLSFAPAYVLRDRSAGSLSTYNLHLNRIYQNPLSISLKDGSSMTELVLDPYFLRSILVPTSTELNVPPGVKRDELVSYITTRLTPKQKQYFNPLVAYQNTKQAINLRFMGEETPVVLGVDDGPSSAGELSARYLEIDLSQQKMYFFIDHALYKEYRVSTGAEYPTPLGEYHILNKAPKAFSDIYNVWMPYWMGFTYARDVGAYLGIHEIAYALNDKGKPFYKHGYYIGDMFTGGCIAMEPKDSREIYNLSDVGMLVRIVK